MKTIRVAAAVIHEENKIFATARDCFWCERVSGDLELLEADEARWLGVEELHSVKWLPADAGLLDKVRIFMEQL